jgi:hypothetical protein
MDATSWEDGQGAARKMGVVAFHQRSYYRGLRIGIGTHMVHRSASKRAGRRNGAAATGRTPVPLVLDADRYGGRWIATLGGHVVATGENLVELNRSLDEKGFGTDVILTKVPRTGDIVL